MDNSLQILNLVPSLGSSALLLYVWLMVNKDRAARDQIDRDDRAATRKEFLDKLGSIEAAHREEERADREQNRILFDRVIAICNELSKAVSALDAGVRGLSTATQANERAIVDLREEMTLLREMGARHPADAPTSRRRPGPPRGPDAGPQP